MGRSKRAVVEYRNYELPSGFPITYLTGDEWRISHIPSGRLHIHNCLEIGLCHAEHGTIVFGDTQLDFRAGDVTCVARNVPHTTYSAPDCASLWSYLYLDPQALLDQFPWEQATDALLTQQMLCSSHMILSERDYPAAHHIVTGILDELVHERPHYQMAVRSMCLTLMMVLLRAYSENHQSEDVLGRYMFAIAPAIDYIHQNYMHEFPQEVLAEVCHLSATHFRRLFHEQMNVNPLTFLHQTRILQSCTLLRTTDVSIAEIAGRVGYTSLSSYNRNFLRIMACTPSEWRRSSGETRPTIVTYSGWRTPEKL